MRKVGVKMCGELLQWSQKRYITAGKDRSRQKKAKMCVREGTQKSKQKTGF